jgi:polysaccharide export outer membrane protein
LSPPDPSNDVLERPTSERQQSVPDLRVVETIAGPVDPRTYVIGPGDLLQLNYSGRVSRAVILSVGPEGSAFIPGWGVVKLGGLTLENARRLIKRDVASQLRGVQLDLTLVRVRKLRIQLTGDVKQAGPLEFVATSRASDAIADTLLKPTASRRNIEVRHQDGSVQIADLARFNLTGIATDNPYLLDGDVLHVPAASRFVEVRGAVAHPGRFELGPHDSLRTMLDLAGGAMPSARSDRALLVRWRSPTVAESASFDLAAIARGADNPPVHDGDRLYIYFVPRYHDLEQAAIYGEVQRPGSYPLASGLTRLSDLVSSAGGFTDRADLSTIHVYRATASSQEFDPELDRLSRLSRSEMTGAEYDILRTRLTEKRGDYRVEWARVRERPELDIVLIAGDIVQVDPIRATVRVEGEVRRPGLVQYDPKLDANDYVKLAGGFSNRAAAGKVLVTRRLTGQTLRAHDVDQVSPGDMIWVPEKPEISIWQNLQTLVAVAAQVATVIIAVRR